jgi:hypothetical protein
MFEVAHLEEPVVVHRVPILGNLALPAPVTEGIPAYAEILRRLLYP